MAPRTSPGCLLAGRETRVQVLDTTIALVDLREEEANLEVDQQDVTCTEGTDVAAGSLSTGCTRGRDGHVGFTARPL